MTTSVSLFSLFNSLLLHLLVCLVIISLPANGFSSSPFEGRKIAQHRHLQLIHNIQVSNLLPSPDCKHSTKVGKGKAFLKVVNKHGPCSHWNQQNGNAINLVEILHQDQARVDSIHSKFSDVTRTSAAKLPTKGGASLGTGNYIVSIGLGSPVKELPLIFDTGSDLTWARCSSAETFDPAKSASYSNISCTSPVCSSSTSATGNPSGCVESACIYGLQYGDGSYSLGFLGKERLTVATDVFDDFYFGCGQENEGLFGKAGGLLGLGRDKLSVVFQTASKYNKIFSYCIPASPSSTGFLSFGSSQSNSAQFTPLSASSSSSNFYNLDMTGIAVGGKKLTVPSSNSGTIIDSGTVVTRLPPTVYEALRSAFREAMANYPMAQPLSILDTCYDFRNYTTVNVPKIELFFPGVGVQVDQEGIFIANGIEQVCLAFAGNGDDREKAIFGNTQQKNFEVVYDVGGGKVGFAPASCS